MHHILCIAFYTAIYLILSLYFVIYNTRLLLIIIYIKDHFSFTSPHLSSLCLVAHKAFTESLHLSQLAATVSPSSHDCHPASALSSFAFQLFSSRWLLVFLFFFFLPVPKLLLCCCLVLSQYMFNHPPSMLCYVVVWSCLSICSIILHLLCFTSLLIGFMSALCSRSSVLTFFIGADVGTGGIL